MKLEIIYFIFSIELQVFSISYSSESDGYYAANVKIIPIDYSKVEFNQSAILFFETKDELYQFNLKAVLTNIYYKKLIFLIFCLHCTVIDLKELHIKHYLDYGKGHISQFEYFFIRVFDEYQLVTFEWFTEHDCNRPQLTTLNQYSKTKSLQWKTELKFEEKFKNFHKCVMIYRFPDNVIYRRVRFDDFLMIDAVAKRSNFTYHSSFMNHQTGVRFIPEYKGAIPKENIVLEYLLTPSEDQAFITAYFRNILYVFELTVEAPYTSYEKLFFPFDETIFLISVFCVAFGVTLIVNQLPKSIQDEIYGENVNTPTMNIVAIFFGIGQTRLPRKNFARIILILFIWFCLIFRTCYQSKLFEFMTSDPRRPSPKSIDDLYDNNFRISTLSLDNFQMLQNMIPEYKRPKFYYNFSGEGSDDLALECFQLYASQIQNSSAKIAFSLDEDLISFLQIRYKVYGVRLDEPLATLLLGFGVSTNHFIFSSADEVLRNLLPAGIPQKNYDNLLSQRIGLRKIVLDIKEPKVLKIETLSFGFVIWLVTCAFSFAVFLKEILGKYMVKLICQEVIYLFFRQTLRRHLNTFHV